MTAKIKKNQPIKSKRSRSKVVGTMYGLEVFRRESERWDRVAGAYYSFIEDATRGAQALVNSTGCPARIVKIVTSVFRTFQQESQREHKQSHPT